MTDLIRHGIWLAERCSRCGGSLYKDYSTAKCINCGCEHDLITGESITPKFTDPRNAPYLFNPRKMRKLV